MKRRANKRLMHRSKRHQWRPLRSRSPPSSAGIGSRPNGWTDTNAAAGVHRGRRERGGVASGGAGAATRTRPTHRRRDSLGERCGGDRDGSRRPRFRIRLRACLANVSIASSARSASARAWSRMALSSASRSFGIRSERSAIPSSIAWHQEFSQYLHQFPARRFDSSCGHDQRTWGWGSAANANWRTARRERTVSDLSHAH
jgi:hypothetical protein